MKTACKCGCGKDNKPEWFIDLVKLLENIYGDGIYITSGNRCKSYNAFIGGATNSRHLKGDAFDIAHIKVPAKILYMTCLIKYPYNKGIGYYPYNGFIHIDGRLLKKRWYRDAANNYYNISNKDFINKYILDMEVQLCKNPK